MTRRCTTSPPNSRRCGRAWEEGDHEALLALLDPEAVLRSDGGGRVNAAGRPLHGGERIARGLVALRRSALRTGRTTERRAVRVNGSLGLLVIDREAVNVISLTIDAGRIVAIDVVRNPDKLRGVGGAGGS